MITIFKLVNKTIKNYVILIAVIVYIHGHIYQELCYFDCCYCIVVLHPRSTSKVMSGRYMHAPSLYSLVKHVMGHVYITSILRSLLGI